MALPPNIPALGVRISIYEFQGDTNIQSITLLFILISLIFNNSDSTFMYLINIFSFLGNDMLMFLYNLPLGFQYFLFLFVSTLSLLIIVTIHYPHFKCLACLLIQYSHNYIMSYRVDIEGNIGVVFNIKEYFIVAKFLWFIETKKKGRKY